MKTVKVTPDDLVSVIDVNFDSQYALKKAVGGQLKTVRTRTLYNMFKMPVVMLTDKDGLLKNKEINRLGSYFFDIDRHGWPIVGDIVFAVDTGEEIEAPEDAEGLRTLLKLQFPYLEENE